MSGLPTVEAARALLATIGAGRASILHLAVAHLDFGQVVRVNAALSPEVDRMVEAEAAAARQFRVLRPRPPLAQEEDVDDEHTPRDAVVVSPTAGKGGARRPPSAPARVESKPRPSGPEPRPERRAAKPVAAPPTQAAPAPVQAPPAAVAKPATPPPPAAKPVAAPPPPAAATAPVKAPPAPPAARLLEEDFAGVEELVLDDPDGESPTRPSAPVPSAVRAVRPAGVRAAGPSLSDDSFAAAGSEDDDVDAGAGTGMPVAGGGLRLGRAPIANGPQLTDDAEAAPADSSPQVANIQPAGGDSRIAQLMADAVAAAGRGEFVGAIQSFTDLVDLRHDRSDAHLGRGRCYLELGDYSSAMSDFQRAEDLQPHGAEPHLAMGDLYFARKEFRRAIDFYDQAVAFDAGHAMARCRRGISHYYRKNYRQAFEDLQRAASLDPDIPNIRKYVQMAVKKMERGY